MSSTSKHVNEAVQFINWLYSDQANYDLFFYGIEGQHYTLNDDGSINTLNTNWAFDDLDGRQHDLPALCLHHAARREEGAVHRG